MINIHYIGHPTTIEGWPQTNTIAGLLDALGRWTLDPRLDMREPEEQHLPAFRSRAWGDCSARYDVAKARTVYEATTPIYPESPDAVRYFGNFMGYSYAFSLDTDEPELIAQLDAAIGENMSSAGYSAALQEIRESVESYSRRWARQRG